MFKKQLPNALFHLFILKADDSAVRQQVILFLNEIKICHMNSDHLVKMEKLSRIARTFYMDFEFKMI